MMDTSGLPFPKGRTRKQVKASAKRQAAQVVAVIRAQVVARAQGRCERCRTWLGKEGHAHHKTLRSHGGTWTLGNIIYLCASCHARAHGRTA